jgi:hypothetical protein
VKRWFGKGDVISRSEMWGSQYGDYKYHCLSGEWHHIIR